MELALSITIFALFGIVFVLAAMVFGAILRPRIPNPDKLAAYECGEPAIGSSWIQFDLRFYIVALVFLVFDVEVSLFYPWAVAYGSAPKLAAQIGKTLQEIRGIALVDMLFFFAILLVGFAYLWRFGYLDWVRSAATTSMRIPRTPGADLSREARIDPETRPAPTHAD